MSNYALSLTRECQTLSCSGQRNVKFRDILDKGMSNSPLSCTMDDQIPLKISSLLDKRFSIPSYPRKLIFKFRLNSTEGGCQTPRVILKMGLSNSELSSPWDCQALRYPHHGIVKLSANRNMWVSICTLSLTWGCQKQTFCTILVKGFLNFALS